MPTTAADNGRPPLLRTAVVMRVEESACEVWSDGRLDSARFAPQFPTPRRERVSPGHLVALATAADGGSVVVWRWYDAVVVGHDHDGRPRLWEPAHGEVVADRRPGYREQPPGARVYASAGLPGAEWWVACAASPTPGTTEVELDAVDDLYTENGLWASALAQPPRT